MGLPSRVFVFDGETDMGTGIGTDMGTGIGTDQSMLRDFTIQIDPMR
jgi:hypothetical protein